MEFFVAGIILILIIPYLFNNGAKSREDILLRRVKRLETKVERLMQHTGLQDDTPPGNMPQTAIDYLKAGQKINAIRVYRQQTGVGLKEAKAAVEDYEFNFM